ncbi:hypothetical protein TA3x_004919 [Tundrisphaera sp. TA3]|uniref:hypothetical protein n=1 Tax=Tundrisphaera sp. TA3 TaxID=3435775 RepID=UPI003EBA9511
MKKTILGLAVAALAASAPAARAGDHHHIHTPRHVPSLPQTHHQAGHPQCVSPLAHPSDTGHYRGGYVGGGSAHPGDHGRRVNEGTWGWDYVGLRPGGSRIFNNWSHGRRYQGGYSTYKTDGPKPVEHLIETIHGEKGKE